MNASIFLFGVLLGMKHATEADHLAALATLVAREHSWRRSVRLGLAWGVGHTATLMLFGGVVLALGRAVPQRIEQALEIAVGLMLIGLGASVLRDLRRRRIHFHVHRHGAGAAHVHAHSHAGEGAHAASMHRHAHRPLLLLQRSRSRPAEPSAPEPPAPRLLRRALAVGMMHGMAGSAALVVLGVEAARSWTTGLLYIAPFGVGSIVGMASLSIVITVPLRWSARRLGRLHRGMSVLSGCVSCALGVFIVCRTGFAAWD